MMVALRGTAASTVVVSLLLVAVLVHAQGTPPPSPLTLLSRDGRRAVPTTMLSGQELIALDDVARLFGVTVREDALAGGITVTYRTQSIVMSSDQPMASVSGRVVTLPSPLVRAGQRWLVPVEFLTRALAPIYDQPIDLRRASRLLVVGTMRVPRVAGRVDAPGPATRATFEVAPATPVTIATDPGRVLLALPPRTPLKLGPGRLAGGALFQANLRPGNQPHKGDRWAPKAPARENLGCRGKKQGPNQIYPPLCLI